MPTNPVAIFNPSNYLTQDASTYKASIDGNNAVATRIIDQFTPHPAATPNMTVVLDAGCIFSGTTLTEIAQQTSSSITAPSGSNKRIDRAVINATTGALSILTGTPTSGTPSPPAITAGNLPVAQIGTTASPLVSSTTAITNNMISDERNFWSANPTLLTGYTGGGSNNILHNNQAAIAQHGTSGTCSTSGNNYCLDRIFLTATGASVTWSQSSTYALPNSQGTASNYLAITGNTSNTDVTWNTRVESFDSGIVAGQQCTFYVVISNNTGASLTPTLTWKYPTAADNYASTTTDSTVNAVSLQTLGSSGFGILAYTSAVNSNANLGMQITVDFGAMSSNSKNVSIVGWGLVPTPGIVTGQNNNPPPVELHPYSRELTNCQRYFFSTFPTGTTPAQNAGTTGCYLFPATKAGANLNYSSTMPFPVKMRSTSPSVTLFNPSASNAQIRDLSASADCSASATQGLGSMSTGLSCTANSSTVVANLLGVHITANAEL